MFERLALRVKAGKRRQQRGMDVEDAIGEVVEQRAADQAHEAGETDDRNASPRQQIRQRPIVAVAIPIVSRAQMNGVDPGVTRPLQTLGVAAVRDHRGDCGLEPTRGDRLDDRLQIAPAP